MLEAYGWVTARSSRDAYQNSTADERDAIDERVDAADQELFAELQSFLTRFEAPDLDWHFRSRMNNASGVLTLASSCNHRGSVPTILEVLHWLAQRGPGSYGIVYLHDDEDLAQASKARDRDGRDHSNAFRVWRLCRGRVEEFDDPFLSPIVPTLHPPED